MFHSLRTIIRIAVASLLLISTSVLAQDDHLKCFKVKDSLTKTSYTADLSGLVAEPGCVIKLPAVMACVPASKTNITPTPPGGGGTGTPNAFGCYKVKCPKATLPQLGLIDQFGARLVTPKSSKLVCAPSPVVPPSQFCVPLCSPDVCSGTATACDQACASNTAGCFCVSTTESLPACVQASCTYTPCVDSTDCAAGSVCFTEGCCG